MEDFKLDSIEDALKDFREGKFVIVVDDEDRENEGDLIMAAEMITPEKVNFMLKNARGVLCVPIMAWNTWHLSRVHGKKTNLYSYACTHHVQQVIFLVVSVVIVASNFIRRWR